MLFEKYSNLVIAIVVMFFCSSPFVAGRKADSDKRLTPEWLKSSLLQLQEKAIVEAAGSRVQGEKAIEKGFSPPDFIPHIAEEHGEGLPQSSATEKAQNNPFLRWKRSTTCQPPANLTELVKDLNTRLNNTQYVGLIPSDSAHLNLPTNQPNTCLNKSRGGWWPPTSTEENLLSTCPWKKTEKDLGEGAFPRYVEEAVCLCSDGCMNDASMRCAEIRQTFTYFQRQGCQDNNLALMNKRTIKIVTGCHCISAAEQSAGTAPVVPPPLSSG